MQKTIRVSAFILWLVFTALNLYIELDPRFLVNIPIKLALAVSFVLLWSIAFPPTRRHLRIWLTVLFLYYVWVLLNLLFFDAAFGREQVHYGINLRPFYTIRNYIRVYQRGHLQAIAATNLLGNVAAFAPMGFFLPSLSKKMRNFLIFLFTMIFLISGVEVIQVVTNCGSGDIDDFILNLAGAVLCWLVFYPLSRHINRLLRGYS